MRHKYHSENRKIAAGIICAMMLVIMLFSAFYIAAEAGHECTGEDCPVCVCIRQCEKALHEIGDGLSAQAAVILPLIALIAVVYTLKNELPAVTLVSRKVRMDD